MASLVALGLAGAAAVTAGVLWAVAPAETAAEVRATAARRQFHLTPVLPRGGHAQLGLRAGWEF
jgi:hypothetical protein